MCRWPCKYGEAGMLCGRQWFSSERKPDSKKPASAGFDSVGAGSVTAS